MKLERGKVNVLLDLTYGSSAKGQICASIADKFRPEILIGTSSTSASHTVIEGNESFVFKVLPSASFLNRFRDDYDPLVVLAPSAGFELEQLKKEIEFCGLTKDKVIIAHRSMVVLDKHKKEEAERMGSRLGSTHSGQSAAMSEKIARAKGVKLAGDYPEIDEIATVVDYPAFAYLLAGMLSNGRTALLEMPQGFPLSLDYSIEYPFNTFRNISPAQAMSDIGLNPQEFLGSVIGNFRAFPIRVSNRFVGDSMDGVKLHIETVDGAQEVVSPDEVGMTYSDVNAIVYIVMYRGEPIEPYGFDFKVVHIEGVEGTSGAFDDDLVEVSWRHLIDNYNVEDEEITTLTKLNRRIAVPMDTTIPITLISDSMVTIRPDYLSVTFVNYDLVNGKTVEEFVNDAMKDLSINNIDATLSIVQTGKDLSDVHFI